jgi:hypothetical protein
VPGDHVGLGGQVIQAFLVGQPVAECLEVRPFHAVSGQVGADTAAQAAKTFVACSSGPGCPRGLPAAARREFGSP